MKDGYTIAKVFDEKESLAGKRIKVKGKVVKFNEDILDRNWIHIQDGSGEQGKHDLVVTTTSSVQIGQNSNCRRNYCRRKILAPVICILFFWKTLK